MPVDNVYASRSELIDDIQRIYDGNSLTVVSPDVGGVVRARALLNS